MSHNSVTPTSFSSCLGCIHLRYTGPHESKQRTRTAGEPPIPLYPQEQTSPGTYRCGRFGERLTSADKTPEPLVAGGACKERR